MKYRSKKKIYYLLIIIIVLTITIGYAVINRNLTITGNSEVKSNTWDIHFENVKVKSGSVVASKVPTIDSEKNGIDFSVVLNLPGDFYEFTVDVVNSGSMDGMVDRISKTPELTTAQAKYLKYEVTYQNGESIASKQNIPADVTMPIKVRVEYRTDLNAIDLPTTNDILNLGLTLNYVQSDGTGTDVKDNGAYPKQIANGLLDDIGTIVTIGDQQFYTIGTEGDNVKLLSMYNLYVGGVFDGIKWTVYGDEATGKQDSNMLGWVSIGHQHKGTTAFSDIDSTYAGSIVEGYVNDYKIILERDYGVDVIEARLISYDELIDSETFDCVDLDFCSDKYPWIYSTSYWSGSARYASDVWCVYSDAYFINDGYDYDDDFGVRPVIVIPKEQIIVP